VVVAILPES